MRETKDQTIIRLKREVAELKEAVRGQKRMAKEKIKESKEVILAIGGCMMQEQHITDKIHESYPYTDIIFGTHTLHKLPEDLYNTLVNNKKVKVFTLEKNMGKGYALNYGLKIAMKNANIIGLSLVKIELYSSSDNPCGCFVFDSSLIKSTTFTNQLKFNEN